MKKSDFIFVFSFLTVSTVHAETWTLQKCYERAALKNESIAIQSLEVAKAQAAKNQTLSASLPTLQYHHTILWQENLPSSTGVGANFTKSPLPEGAFQVRLPLLRGFTEWFAVQGGKSYVEQKEQEKKYVELQTYSTVASFYFNILLYQKNIELTDKALSLTKSRYDELRRFVQLGRSKKSDLLELQNNLNVLEIEKLDLLSQVKIARNNLESLVGEPIEELSPIPDFLGKRPASIETAQMIASRQDVMAKKAAVEVARAANKATFSNHLPGLDAAYNYYTQRSGIREGIDWDFTLNLTVPLFAFGNTYYANKQTKAALREQELALEKTMREAKLEIQTVWDQLQADVSKLPLVKKSVELTQEDYDIQSKEYRLGLVDNFHVLDALSKLHDAELSYEKLQLQASFDVIRLHLAQGKLPS